MREIFVQKTFLSKSVFITGATGFLGKVLIEKLLRSCSGVSKIYVLIRPKDGKSILSRFEELKDSEAFEKVKQSNPNAMEKLVPVEGDLTISPFAGLSEETKNILSRDVSFVFHCAAPSDDNSFETAIKVNLIGTKMMLDLAENCEKFESFIHISHAFSNLNKEKVFEEVYKSPFDYKNVMECVEAVHKDKLRDLSKIVLKTFPNALVFSKNITEQLLSDRSKKIPVAIIRPAILAPSFEEPHPGWTDTFKGPAEILIGATSGTLRSIHGNSNRIIDLMPCDYAVNSMIVAAASVASNENKSLVVFNCTSSKQTPLTCHHFLELGSKVYGDYPSTGVIWFPGGKMCSNYIIYLLRFILLQLIPAIFIDFLCLVTGRKTWALQLQKNMFQSLKSSGFLFKSSCEWDNLNFELLYNLITLDERQNFNFDVSNLDYRNYIRNWIKGSRRFLLRIDDETLPKAKQLYKILKGLNIVIKTTFYSVVSYKIYNWYFGTSGDV